MPYFLLLLVVLVLSFLNPLFAREKIQGPVEAEVVQVRDGDSVNVVAHVWPGHDVRVSIRLRGIDAPELKARCSREKQMAIAARDRLVQLLGNGKIQLTKISGGKYFGRMLARIYTNAGVDVQKQLLKEGLVRPYVGGKRRSWCLGQATKLLK